mmetsp:Transcript_13586/g.42028  ORF Transcript_13586/g.42028 Transcript_13586/m.42028 type:complete len:264 (-) Transcript_13586:43-834(-)
MADLHTGRAAVRAAAEGRRLRPRHVPRRVVLGAVARTVRVRARRQGTRPVVTWHVGVALRGEGRKTLDARARLDGSDRSGVRSERAARARGALVRRARRARRRRDRSRRRGGRAPLLRAAVGQQARHGPRAEKEPRRRVAHHAGVRAQDGGVAAGGRERGLFQRVTGRRDGGGVRGALLRGLAEGAGPLGLPAVAAEMARRRGGRVGGEARGAAKPRRRLRGGLRGGRGGRRRDRRVHGRGARRHPGLPARPHARAGVRGGGV